MNWIGRVAAGAVLVLASAWSGAEDVDLFLKSSSSTAATNVLFIVDNSANWSRPADSGEAVGMATLRALSQILRNLGEDAINVGLLLYTQVGGENSAVQGGYIRSAIRPMDAATRELYARQLESLDIDKDMGASAVSALGFAEAYLYFTGADPWAGMDKVKADYQGNSSADGYMSTDAAVWALPGNALSSRGAARYQGLTGGIGCARNYIVFVSHGPNPDSAANTGWALRLLENQGGDISPIVLEPGSAAQNAVDEWSRFMADSSLGVTTITIDVAGSTDNRGLAWSALLRSTAEISGGSYHLAAANPGSIGAAVQQALSGVFAGDASFASVALPVSANTRSVFLNRVYIGQFRPDGYGRPRWPGNLKQYRLGYENLPGEARFTLLDARNKPVIEMSTDSSASINPCAQSYWTPDNVDTYWNYLDVSQRRGGCPTKADSAGSNSPDGHVVEKGGQAYIGRGGPDYVTADASSRVVKTTDVSLCGGSTGRACALVEFDAGSNAINAALSGVADSVERSRLISWARGADTEDEDGDGDRAEFRPSLHGDVIHSRPLIIDYSAEPGSPQLVLFYGSNDGMLRAVNGNRHAAHNAAGEGEPVAAGGEFWAFMPPDYYSRLERVFGNSPEPRTLATTAVSGAERPRRPYGPDGPLSAWVDISGQRYLAMGMRRGGRTIYGLDVTAAASPRLLWRLGCTTPLGDDSGCADGWENIGETWSALVPVLQPGAETPYLLMGGGYDSCEDYEDPATGVNHRCMAASRGNRIYVLEASTGTIVSSFGTERAVPGAVTVVPVSDSDHNISYAYAADTGGNVYRLSGPGGAPIGTTVPASWELTKIAALGCDAEAGSSCPASRKFLFGPDVIRIPGTSRYGVLLGSGDREKPTAENQVARLVSNYFYAIVDDPADPDWLDRASSNCKGGALCADALTTVRPDALSSAVERISEKGWKIQLRQGEQVVSGALTVADKIHFSTHRAEAAGEAVCSSGLGMATTYSLDYRNGTGVQSSIPGGGLLPTPVAGRVELDDGTVVPFCIGCGDEEAPVGPGEVTGEDSWVQPKGLVYWMIGK